MCVCVCACRGGVVQKQMLALNDYIMSSQSKLQRPVVDIDTLRFVMNCMKELRERDSVIELTIAPIIDTYSLLELYLPPGSIDQVRRRCLVVDGRAPSQKNRSACAARDGPEGHSEVVVAARHGCRRRGVHARVSAAGDV